MMTKRKAFLCGLGAGLGVLLPLYFFTAALSLSRAAPAENPKSGVPILQPTADDRKTLLIMTGEQAPETFVLVRFDALENRIACVSLPGETVVLSNGLARTLLEAVQIAGPAQAAAALTETLKISVDHYLYCKPEELAALVSGLGNAQLKLSNYINADQMRTLRLDIPGVETLSLTPEMLGQALRGPAKNDMAHHLLRAQGYLAFLRAGEHQLSKILTPALRTAAAEYSTNLTALPIYDYERILLFLQKKEPVFAACVLPGIMTNGRYELTEDAVAAAREYLNSAATSLAGAEDRDIITPAKDAVADAGQVPAPRTPDAFSQSTQPSAAQTHSQSNDAAPRTPDAFSQSTQSSAAQTHSQSNDAAPRTPDAFSQSTQPSAAQTHSQPNDVAPRTTKHLLYL